MSFSSDCEDDIIKCPECNFLYNIDDSLEDCEWCDHNRSEQQSCPNCSDRINEFSQILCYPCFYIGYSDSKEIFYCIDCDCFIADYDCPLTFEDNSLHHIERDVNKLHEFSHKKYYKIHKKIFNFFQYKFE